MRCTPWPATKTSSRSCGSQHHDELAEVVTQRISALEGIVATRTLIAFQAYSKHDLEAMWSIGWE